MKKQKICIIGGSLTGLITAISLSKLNCEIDLVIGKNKKKKQSNKTIAISENNFNFIKKLNIASFSKKEFWPFSIMSLYEGSKDRKFTKIFELNNEKKGKKIFYMMKNTEIIKTMMQKIKKTKSIKIKKNENIAKISDLGILPEIEVFDTGHLWLAKKLIQDGLIKDPVLLQLCMGIPWGAPNDINTFLSLINNVPEGWTWSAFSIGRYQMPYVAMAVLGGGNVRVGLEDNIWLEKGRLAKNYELVEKAVNIIENLGSKVMSPDEVRNKLHLKKHDT